MQPHVIFSFFHSCQSLTECTHPPLACRVCHQYIDKHMFVVTTGTGMGRGGNAREDDFVWGVVAAVAAVAVAVAVAVAAAVTLSVCGVGE